MIRSAPASLRRTLRSGALGKRNTFDKSFKSRKNTVYCHDIKPLAHTFTVDQFQCSLWHTVLGWRMCHHATVTFERNLPIHHFWLVRDELNSNQSAECCRCPKLKGNKSCLLKFSLVHTYLNIYIPLFAYLLQQLPKRAFKRLAMKSLLKCLKQGSS